MELLHSNFDTIEISFQGALPEPILQQLSEARERAQNEKSDVFIELGEEKIPVMVAETGARGYKYRFDTGKDGETWFIAHSNNIKNWNIRVSIKSLTLALYGYNGAKAAMMEKLIALKALGPSRYDSALNDNDSAIDTAKIGANSPTNSANSVINTPLERISRVDYCFDIIMGQSFEPDPKQFIAHQRAKKHVYGVEGEIQNYSSLNGDKVYTIRVGSMPNRQVTIYNKTKEIIASRKSYWWDIWGLKEKSFKETFKQIWRVEVRAGREELNKWGLKRFKDFDEKIGDVIAGILKAIRYTKPLKSDLNRGRWPNHPIWDISLKTCLKALEPYRSNAIREDVLRGLKDEALKGYIERTIGNLIGLNTLIGNDISEIPDTISYIESSIREMAIRDKDELYRKVQRLNDRFRFLK